MEGGCTGALRVDGVHCVYAAALLSVEKLLLILSCCRRCHRCCVTRPHPMAGNTVHFALSAC